MVEYKYVVQVVVSPGGSDEHAIAVDLVRTIDKATATYIAKALAAKVGIAISASSDGRHWQPEGNQMPFGNNIRPDSEDQHRFVINVLIMIGTHRIWHPWAVSGALSSAILVAERAVDAGCTFDEIKVFDSAKDNELRWRSTDYIAQEERLKEVLAGLKDGE